MVEIERWDVIVTKNPDADEANDENLSWKVLNKIRFKSADPADWGEFRAYGAMWTRTLNRTHDSRDLMSDAPPKANPTLRSRPRKREVIGQLETHTALPFWGLTLGPTKEAGRAWRLGNDQHMEIFYADVVPGVPRSDPDGSDAPLQDDDNDPDDRAEASSPGDLAGLGTTWHIIARDEPSSGPFQVGDFVEYWHRGEFQVRDPKTRIALPARKQIYLRVNGTFPNWSYRQSIDATTGNMPPSWEMAISSSEDGFETVHYPVRDLTLPRR